MGDDGYRHYQIRLVSSNHDFFEWCKTFLPTAHVEEATEIRDDYERKSGDVLCSYDTPEIRQVRFGNLRKIQEKILKLVDDQDDREIDLFYDPAGCHGKSWLAIHLWERRECFIVPRSKATAEKLSAFICSGYDQEKYIIIDLPRARKPDQAVYELLEDTKDGLVFDSRYSARTRNIRGAKLIVFTNSQFDTKLLTGDRWRTHNLSQWGTLEEYQ